MHTKNPSWHKTNWDFFYVKTDTFRSVLICGGDEENRTPVRKHCLTNFSERSLWLSFGSQPSADNQLCPYLDESSQSSLRELAVRYPAVCPLSVPAGEERTGVALSGESVFFVSFYI